MGCRYDESEGERKRREAKYLLEYACDELGIDVPRGDPVIKLCALLKSMSTDQRDKVVYNARKSKARKLADWYEEHEERDRENREADAREKLNAKLRKSALAKLTDEERRALGV